METKTCTRCGESKPATLEFFYLMTSGRDGLHSQCKACARQRAHELYWANPQEHRAQKRAERLADADHAKEQARIAYWNNRERKRQIARDCRSRNRYRLMAKDRERARRPRHEADRKTLDEWYSQGCVVCGLAFLPGGMHSHHRDETTKTQSASQLLGRKKGTLEAELAQCDPLCASHHFMLEHMKQHGHKGLPYEDIIADLSDGWAAMTL